MFWDIHSFLLIRKNIFFSNYIDEFIWWNNRSSEGINEYKKSYDENQIHNILVIRLMTISLYQTHFDGKEELYKRIRGI